MERLWAWAGVDSLMCLWVYGLNLGVYSELYIFGYYSGVFSIVFRGKIEKCGRINIGAVCPVMKGGS